MPSIEGNKTAIGPPSWRWLLMSRAVEGVYSARTGVPEPPRTASQVLHPAMAVRAPVAMPALPTQLNRVDDLGPLRRLDGIEPAEFFRSQVHRREALLRQRLLDVRHGKRLVECHR
jgi:hypothetical protein